MNILCTICSDLINQAESIFVTKCGHLFHHQCLAQWIERSKSCPQCRNKVTDRCMFRIYPTVSSEAGGESAAALQTRLDDAQLQLRQHAAAQKQLRDNADALAADLLVARERVEASERRVASRESAVAALREQLQCARALAADADALRTDNQQLQTRLELVHGVQRVLSATAEDAERMLRDYSDLRTVATFATALKRALCDSEAKKNESREELRTLRAELAAARRRLAVRRAASEERALEEQRSQKRALSPPESAAPAPVPAARRRRSPDRADLSMNTLVNRIEKAESPYLELQQSNLALALLRRRTAGGAGGMFRRARADASADLFGAMEAASERLDTSYDGLGGHSGQDAFPVAVQVARHRAPRPGARHRLAARPQRTLHDF